MRNAAAWERRPLLRRIYRAFHAQMIALLQPGVPGPVVELGGGSANMRASLPAGSICTDVFAAPGIDVVCDGYRLPFAAGSISHLVMFDVLHHVAAPMALLAEARRALAGGGRVIIMEPYISLASLPVYQLLHHEPVGLWRKIDRSSAAPRDGGYYAAQGNATRLFFDGEVGEVVAGWRQRGWRVVHRQVLPAFSYLLSGGFSRPALYPLALLPALQKLDRALARWPRLFGARCLIGLERD